MASEERETNPLLQQINSHSAALQNPQNPSQDGAAGAAQDSHGQTQQDSAASSRILVPNSSPDKNGQSDSASLPPGGFMPSEQSSQSLQSNLSTPNFYQPPNRPEDMNAGTPNGRPDDAPPPKKRLMRYGDLERSQSPGDIPIQPNASGAISQSSSSDNLSRDIQQVHILSQQNSATGSPAPQGSPSLVGMGMSNDFFANGHQNAAGPTSGLANAVPQNASPGPGTPHDGNRPQSSQSQAPTGAAQSPVDGFAGLKAMYSYLPDAQLMQAWETSGRNFNEATKLLCGSNPLLDDGSGNTAAATAAFPVGPVRSNSHSSASPVPQGVMPTSRPASHSPSMGFNPMHMGGPQPPHPQAGPYGFPPPQRLSPQQMMQHPGMNPYPGQPQPMFYPGTAPGQRLPPQQQMQQQSMAQQQPGAFYGQRPPMYRPSTQPVAQQPASQFHPHQPQQQGQFRPGQMPVVQTRTVMTPNAPPPGMAHPAMPPGFDINNPQHRAYLNREAQMQAPRYPPLPPQMAMAAGSQSTLAAQRQQAMQNPEHRQQMLARQHQAQIAQQQQHLRQSQANMARAGPAGAAGQQNVYMQQQQQMPAQHHPQPVPHRGPGRPPGSSKNAVSKLVAAHRPPGSSSGPGRKPVKRKHNDSDSEDGGDYSEGSDAGARYEEPVNVEKEAEALEFFNICKPHELPDYTACSAEAAQAIVDLRPFESPDDIRAKLKKTKGVSNKLFDSVVDVFEAYAQVDRVFAECEGYGRSLAQVMRIWSGASKQAKAGKAEDTKSLLQPGTAAASAEGEDGAPDIETGVHLVELDEAALDLSAQAAAPPELQAAFNNYLREKPAGVPESINLKGYQMLGLNWLNLLHSKGLSCILADEMGLGKTCQVITFLAHLKAKEHPGPHLVVVPSSTLDNWLREFSTFAPSMRVFAYYGSQASREELRAQYKAEPDLDVIVTTYNMASGNPDDRKFLKKMSFKTCVYDEGHQLKNSESKKYKDLMELRVPWRLLLTGTPLQNNLTELISLLSFILPDTFLGAQDSLRAIFKVPPAAQANMLSRRRIEAAKRVMTPFVLRRKKYQVLQELPAKREQIIHCEMTDEQKTLYRESMQKSKRYLMEVQEEAPLPDNPPPKKGRGRAPKKQVAKQAENSSNILMDLRKAANHPMLFRKLYDDKKIGIMAKDCLKEPEWSEKDPKYIEEDMSVMTDYELHRFVQPYKHLAKHGLQDAEWMKSGKVEWISKHLLEMRERGDRVLLFSQFTQVLDLLEAVLDTLGVRYIKLTGQTNVAERQDMVDEFYEDESITVFLLSTRAGGLGLNLAAANVVILYDQDFNPHNDKQAEDRAWRIGQTRDVTVIRLVMKDTIEEDILAMATTKLTLDSELSKIEGEEPTAGNVEEVAPKEGDEGQTEKRVKNSLLRQIRAQLQRTEDEEAKAKLSQTQAAVKADPSDIKIEEV